MSESSVVLLKTATMFLVIVAGWATRRRGYISAETTRDLGRFVVDVTFPALGFTQMLRTVEMQTLRAEWYLLILVAAVFGIAGLVGFVIRPVFARGSQAPTFIFLVATMNWIYLPLPIVEELFGDAGVRAVLLYNVGSQLVLWTLGVWVLQGGHGKSRALRDLLRNPGLLATVAGIAVALAFPAARAIAAPPAAGASLPLLCGSGVYQALALIGGLTVPLSLLATGAQIGGLDLPRRRGPARDLTGVIVGRLVAAPAVTVLLAHLAALAGVSIPDVPRLVGYLIACMPVAISCSMFTERFGGDVSLGARAIVFTTLGSLLTMPAAFSLIRWLGW